MTASVLISVLIITWLLQILFGYWQIRTFNNAYTKLAQQSCYLGVGKSEGRFKPKVVIILALDKEKKVQNSLIMQGLTVFSRPQPLPELHGMYYRDINPAVIFPGQKRRQQALHSALMVKES